MFIAVFVLTMRVRRIGLGSRFFVDSDYSLSRIWFLLAPLLASPTTTYEK
jgi:hypothetical protein